MYAANLQDFYREFIINICFCERDETVVIEKAGP